MLYWFHYASLPSYGLSADRDALATHGRTRRYSPGWRAMGQRLEKLGDAVRSHGLRLAYHNHESCLYDGTCGVICAPQ